MAEPSLRRLAVATCLVASFLAGCSTARPLARDDAAAEPPVVPVAPDDGEGPVGPDPDDGLVDLEFAELGVVVPVRPAWQAVAGEPARVEGPGGFVNLHGAINDTADPRRLCDTEASHQMRPYGTTPRVTVLQVAGHLGCRVDPSPDQEAEPDFGIVVVRGPRPIELFGESYPLLVVTAQVDHLDAVVARLRFT